MRNDALRTFHDPCTLGSISAIFLGVSLLLFVSGTAIAQVVTNITPTPGSGHLGTTVVQEGSTIYNIRGGTTRGPNLFHSFGEFSVGAADIARFQTTTLTSDLSVSNILGRVTGGNPSNIFGTIDSVTFYPNASLFLMNPAGIVFGPNASLNVGGSVHFTTADYLRLEDNARFTAVPGPNDALLTAFPVAAFGFLGPNAASIAIQGSTLQVAEGQAFTLVGGNRPFVTGNGDEVGSGVTMTGGSLLAPSGRVQIASVDSAGEVVIRTAAGDATFNAESFATLGNIALTEGALLSVSTLLDPDFVPLSENGNGIVRIRGGQFVMDSATVEAHNFGFLNGEPTAIDVDVRGDMTMNNASVQAVTLDAAGGNVMVNAGSLNLMDSNITASSFLAGAGGAINVSTANALTLDSSFIGSFAEDTGSGGPITLSAGTASMTNSGRIESRAFGTATPGDVTLEVAGDVSFTAGGRIVASTSTGTAGNISITAGGDVTVSGQLDTLTPSQIFNGAPSAFENSGAGNIAIIAKNFFLTDRALVDSISLTQPGGNITIHANESVVVSGTRSRILMRVSQASGGLVDISAPTIDIENNGSVRTRTIGEGAAGDIRLAGDNITIANGQVTADSLSLGRAGKISLIATDTLLLSGQFTDEVGQTSPAGVFSQALGNGDGGPISIRAVEVEITSGSTVSAKSTGLGAAGSITIQGTASPAQSLTISGPGSGLFTETQGTGAGGNITTWANQLQLTNGATISSKTTGQMPGAGDAGNILVKADDITISGGATITASSTGTGNAGTVTIQGTHSPAQSLLITGAGSGVFTTTSGTGTGGDILAISDSVLLTNGGTLSAATSGTSPSAVGGTVGVVAGTVRIENGGLVTAASSGPANGGDIAILAEQSVTVNSQGAVSTRATGAGNAGSIGILAGGDFLSGGGSVSTTAAQGTGGDILVAAGQDIRLADQASLSANSSGPGDAGNITALAGDDFVMQNSSMTTQAAQASGGNIKIGAQDQIVLQNSLISASVQGGSGSGGNISIDPTVVVLQNSQILAQAVLGNGGNITITTPLFFADQTSIVDASSQFGVNGTVTIQSPTSNLAGTVASLPSSMRQAQSLQTGRCAALANSQSSSFVVAGRETVPAEPGGWLPSPFASLNAGERLGAQDNGEGLEVSGHGQRMRDEDVSGLSRASDQRRATNHMLDRADSIDQGDQVVLSLRRLTPAGFLTQSFAESGSTGCRS